MSYKNIKLENINQKSKQLLKHGNDLRSLTKGINSYIRFFRKALGMTTSQLGSRTKKAANTISELEKREGEGAVTIKNMIEVADSLNCDFFYTFIPRSSVKETIDKQAFQKAKEELENTNRHMLLEDQEVKISKEDILLKAESIKGTKKLWD